MNSAVICELHPNGETGRRAMQKAHARILASIRRALKALGARITEARRTQRAFEELNAMSDHELEDIGISRADIPAIVAGIYWGTRPAASNVTRLDRPRKPQSPEAAAAPRKKPSNG